MSKPFGVGMGLDSIPLQTAAPHINGDSERACARISIVSELCHVPALLLVLQMGGDSTSRLCQTERKH